MMLDALYQLSNAQALTATGASTNTIDFGVDRDMGRGEPMVVIIVPTVAADFTTGDETYAFALQTDDNDSFSSATTLVSSSILATNLTVGALNVIPLPLSNERYLRLNVTLAGTTPSITFDAYLMPQKDVDSGSGKIYYASGYEV